ncbi:MAG TPA: hypothetical protein VKT32_03100 [Chthonomonadaceae bacterium]|nr:hypothetical protein [Chthonomonadaceae bacterium]
MELLEKTRPVQTLPQTTPPSGGARQNRENLQQASRTLDAYRSTVNRLLSGDSETFNRQVRQRSGQ